MKEFVEKVVEFFTSKYAGYKVFTQGVVKNNDNHLIGLCIKLPCSCICPVIYLNEFYKMYESGIKFSEICENINNIFLLSKSVYPKGVEDFTDFDKVREKICFKLINKERNKEFLKDISYLEFLDLAVIFYILVDDFEDRLTSVIIKESLIKNWDISKEEMFEIAKENSKRLLEGKLVNIKDILCEIVDNIDDNFNALFDNTIPMYVVTNKQKLNGAGVVLYDGLIKEFANSKNSDFYVIPSSVHEVLLIPLVAEIRTEVLKEMVESVNMTELAPSEILSDNVYLYRRETDEFILVEV